MSNKKKFEKPKITGKTENQNLLIEAIDTYETIIVTGPAGTGKTFVTAAKAAEALLAGTITKIVVTRPTVPTGRSLGYFPGSLEEKMGPWLIPLMEVLKEYLGTGKFNCDLKNKVIEVVPFETIRGRSFSNAFVILDEAQNATLDELKAFLTRSGENCTTVINGDITQTDLKENQGLKIICDLIKSNPNLNAAVPLVEFTTKDIVRSGICKLFVEAFAKMGNDKQNPSMLTIVDNKPPKSDLYYTTQPNGQFYPTFGYR